MSIRMSFGSILISTSSASGNTATVTAEVWTRPCCSVSGTRCTRCAPLSYLSLEYAPRPSIMAITSLRPPTPDSELDMTSTFQRCDSAYREYMRNISAANSDDSSPPVPARISRMTLRSSLGSLGNSKSLRSSSAATRRVCKAESSSSAIAFKSASFSSVSIALVSAMPRFRSLYSR